ncbi:hypothetical protein E2C01_065813 [Portunus trituberculatus]|uniref:Uncharacterized protein n=1 Tax=Portunus trituberculatus TaxID=210409 RepID=A0A5B7HSV0_PORTR|nr:hypothetical protein [Portunus trituberculatus]
MQREPTVCPYSITTTSSNVAMSTADMASWCAGTMSPVLGSGWGTGLCGKYPRRRTCSTTPPADRNTPNANTLDHYCLHCPTVINLLPQGLDLINVCKYLLTDDHLDVSFLPAILTLVATKLLYCVPTPRSVVVSTLDPQSRGPGSSPDKWRGKWASLLMCSPCSPSSK